MGGKLSSIAACTTGIKVWLGYLPHSSLFWRARQPGCHIFFSFPHYWPCRHCIAKMGMYLTISDSVVECTSWAHLHYMEDGACRISISHETPKFLLSLAVSIHSAVFACIYACRPSDITPPTSFFEFCVLHAPLDFAHRAPLVSSPPSPLAAHPRAAPKASRGHFSEALITYVPTYPKRDHPHPVPGTKINI